MPGFDRTGPMGQGSLTGRRRGRCLDSKTTESEKTNEQTTSEKEIIYGLGRGGRPCGGGGMRKRFGGGGDQGRGRGRGFGRK